jgi:UDP-N-acetylmuramate: L-alanyl-gamma-D-glutamyl-meso-diaminopimelate ligase
MPKFPRHVHLIGICGTGMSALAGLFHETGCTVTGSDQGMYPPISDLLSNLRITVKEGYSPTNLSPRPDLVVVGNVIRRTNPEAIALESSGIPFTSLPEALRAYFMDDKTRIVVTGTHGKTTVTSMIAWVLHALGLDPGFMVGGIPLNFGKSYRLGNGRFFVVEGDEYDTAYFDKSPKFLHYDPHIGIITSCEFDHGDIYASLEQIQEQFRAFARSVPPDGSLIAWTQDPRVRAVVEHSNGRVHSYGLDAGLEWRVPRVEVIAEGTRAEVIKAGRSVARGTFPLFGFHNISNALAALAACATVGIEPQSAVDALSRYRGVQRRQETLAEIWGVLVIDDFAHHPTAVGVTCDAIRSRFPARRLVAVFEPRTNTSRRSAFQDLYVPAFLASDLTLLEEPSDVEGIPVGERFSSARLADDLRRLGKEAYAFPDTESIIDCLSENLEQGDVVLIMSSGSFDNLAFRLLRILRERAP